MKKYLAEVTEWMAQLLLTRAAARALEIIGHDDRPTLKTLPAPRLIELEHVER